MFLAFDGHARVCEHDDTAVTFPDRSLNLGHEDIDVAEVRQDGERNISWTGLAPLGQSIVVGLHASKLECRIVGKLKESASSRIVWKENLAIDPILV
jgi:hypothetical protein